MEARQDWLEARKTGIGGSDAAVVCGVSQWSTPLELYLEKRGEISDPFNGDTPEHMRFGNLLEEVIAQEFATRTGKRVRRVKQMKRHPEHGFMIANIDRKIEGVDRLLECKTANAFAFQKGDWGEEGTDEVPEYYLMQIQHYLAVTGYDVADLAVLVGGQSLKLYVIERDDPLISTMIDMEGEFWERVQTANAPPATLDHSSTIDLLKRRYTGTNGMVVDLPKGASDIHDRKKSIAAEVKLLNAEGKEITAALLEMVGENAAGRFVDAEGGYRRKLMEGKTYEVNRKEYYDFRWVKNI